MINLKKINEKPNYNRLLVICLITIIGFIVAALSCYVMGKYFGKGYPSNTMFFFPDDRFKDYYHTLESTFAPHQSVRPGSGYFPFMYITLIPFAFIPQFISLIVYFSLFGLVYYSSSIITLFDVKNKIETAILSFVLFSASFPFLYMIDRGNIEATVYIFVLLFVFFYRKKMMTLSAIFLAMAISCKFFPAVFILIYFKDKKYKEMLKVCIFTAIFTVGSFFLLKGNMDVLLNNLKEFNRNYFVENWGLPFSHSLHTLFKYILELLQNFNLITAEKIKYLVGIEVNIYLYVVLFCLAIISIYLIVFEKVGWRLITILTISMLLFSNVSYDYRMIYLMIPIMLFIVSNEKLSLKLNIYYSILFGLMLIPKHYYITPFSSGNSSNIGGLINPLLFIIMITSIMYQGLRGKKIIPSIKDYLRNFLKKSVNNKEHSSSIIPPYIVD